MNKDAINISSIETYLYSIMNSVISVNTYAGTPPDTLKEAWNDMCVIDCGDISDVNAFGAGTVLIWLYARPLADGSKNTAVMSAMEKRLNEVIKNSKSQVYQINRGRTYTNYDSDRKWHCNIVELNITIY